MARSLARMAAAAMIILLACASPLAAGARITKGEKSFGPKVGYVGKNSSIMAGLFFQYTFSRHFRLAPDIGIDFRNKDMDALMVNINAHVPFGFEDDKVALYPLAGIDFTSWNIHGRDEASMDDVNTHKNRFGLNLGGGVELRCTSSFKLSLEAKYVLIKDYSYPEISLGASFIF